MTRRKIDFQKGIQAIVILLILCTVAFIWGNSIPSIPESKAESLAVVEIVKPVLEPIVGVGKVTDHLVRKLAHFAEFGLLGCLLTLLLLVRRRCGVQPVINCLFVSLAAAVIDETIQTYSNRGSQVQDVCLDFAGALSGVLLVLLAAYIARAVKGGRAKKKPLE